MGAFSGWSLTQRPQLRLVVGGKAGPAPGRGTVVELRAVSRTRDKSPSTNGRHPRRHRRPA